MNRFFAAIRHNLVSLLRFGGRDTPAQFWPYAGFVLAILFIVTAAVMLPPIASAMAQMPRIAAANPDQLVVAGNGLHQSISTNVQPDLVPNVQGIIQPMIFLSALAVFLLAAAVVRRLHDRNASGWWAALPVAFLLIGLAMMPRLFRNFASAPEPDFALFFVLFANNLFYLLSIVLLILLLAGAGTRGPNRFGADPREHRSDQWA
jgi:uncharacterized membrane protein YhaH (DUF805 family)